MAASLFAQVLANQILDCNQPRKVATSPSQTFVISGDTFILATATVARQDAMQMDESKDDGDDDDDDDDTMMMLMVVMTMLMLMVL